MDNQPAIKLCECGCGQPAPIAKRTRAKRGIFQGQPMRFCFRHEQKAKTRQALVYTGEPVYCACGCGLLTPISTKTYTRNGIIKGQPTKYIRGHATGRHETDAAVQVTKDLECRRRYKREQRARMREHVKTYFLTHPCIDCGISNPLVLDFDHRNPSEKYKGISQIVANCLGIATLIKEIEKCDVRCSNCHRIRHSGQNTV